MTDNPIVTVVNGAVPSGGDETRATAEESGRASWSEKQLATMESIATGSRYWKRVTRKLSSNYRRGDVQAGEDKFVV